MQNVSVVYQEQSINNNSFNPVGELKDNYTTKIKSFVTSQKLNINNRIDGALFLAENLKREVLNGTSKQQRKNLKQLKRLLIQFTSLVIATGMGSILGMNLMSPHSVKANNPMITAPTTPEITPSKIMDWGLEIALIIFSIGVALSISLFIIAGIYRMITRKGKETSEWNSDIIKGLVQVLVSIPLIYSLFQIAQYIFKNLSFLEGLM